ncbi:MAG TPA: hypothetical protein VFZ73_05255 [Gemmatimonadaceae bacterium]
MSSTENTLRQGGSVRTRTRQLSAALAIITSMACIDQASPPTAPARSLNTLATAQVAASDTPDQLSVAQVVPGFGGYFIDETGAPTVYLTDPARRADAAAALAGFLDSFGWTAADLRVRQAKYSYQQLDAWYRAAWPIALGVSGAVSTDLDEGRNRLRFTGVNASAVAAIVSAVAGLGIPDDALVVEVRGPVRQVVGLRDKVRPPAGGFQLQFFASPASPLIYLCTLGFNAVQDGVNSFITNSHCSNVQGGITIRTDYYQAVRGGVMPDPNNFIAFEVEDPDYTMSAECPVGRSCRYSDASRAQYAAGQVFTLGQIARPTVLNTTLTDGDVTPTILAINDASPSYRIAAEQHATVLGQSLNKVGRTTGWTQGTVTATCENVSVTDSHITQLCQSLVSAYVDGGDSGSPVFGMHADGTAFLAGILWGSSTDLVTNEVQFIFSPLGQVEAELGELATIDPTATGGKKKKKAR